MDDFNTIRLKKKTIEKFKKYSKNVSPSYSETIEYMIAFFEDNDLSPFDVLGENMTSSTNRINKRMDAVATILKNMEKTQLIPTRELLESLFKEEEEKQPLQVEKKTFEEPTLITENEELTYYRDAYYKNKSKLNEFQNQLKEVFDSFKLIKNTFGSNYYQLKMNAEDFKILKDKLANDSL